MLCDARNPMVKQAICSLDANHEGSHYDTRLGLNWFEVEMPCRDKEPLSSTHFCTLQKGHVGSHIDQIGDSTWPNKEPTALEKRMSRKVQPSIEVIKSSSSTAAPRAHRHCAVCEEEVPKLVEFTEPPSIGPFLCEPNRMSICLTCIKTAVEKLEQP